MKTLLAVAVMMVALNGCSQNAPIPVPQNQASYCVNLKSGEYYSLHGITKITKDSQFYWFYIDGRLLASCQLRYVRSIEKLKHDDEVDATVEVNK